MRRTELLLDLVVKGAPHAKERPRRARHGAWYTPRPTSQAEEYFAQAARETWAGHHLAPYTDRVAVEIVFWLPSKRRIDLDNLVKLVTDALMPDVIADDSQIWSLGARKAFSRVDPRTELQLFSLNEEPPSAVVHTPPVVEK